MQMVVGNRFMVEVNAEGVEMNDVKSLLGKIDVAKLEAMKGEGRKELMPRRATVDAVACNW